MNPTFDCLRRQKNEHHHTNKYPYTESAKLARLRTAFAAFEEARDEAIQCQRDYEAEPLHSRIMRRVDKATEWTWGRGMLIGGLIVLIFSGGLRTIIQCLTGAN